MAKSFIEAFFSAGSEIWLSLASRAGVGASWFDHRSFGSLKKLAQQPSLLLQPLSKFANGGRLCSRQGLHGHLHFHVCQTNDKPERCHSGPRPPRRPNEFHPGFIERRQDEGSWILPCGRRFDFG